MKRVLASKMIRTNVPIIDLFNCLVESQKIPIFSIFGEPYNPFLARIGIQADADIVVFAGLGLIFDDFHFFRTQFELAGVFGRTVMYCNMASDPIVERLLVPDMALAVAERFKALQCLLLFLRWLSVMAFHRPEVIPKNKHISLGAALTAIVRG